jgi:hypothetical protein
MRKSKFGILMAQFFLNPSAIDLRQYSVRSSLGGLFARPCIPTIILGIGLLLTSVGTALGTTAKNN